MKKRKEFGKHYLVEFIGCDPETIKYVAPVEKLFLRAARRSKARVVRYFFHQYKPFGVTGVILIQWSHFSLHTWIAMLRLMFLPAERCSLMLPLRS